MRTWAPTPGASPPSETPSAARERVAPWGSCLCLFRSSRLKEILHGVLFRSSTGSDMYRGCAGPPPSDSSDCFRTLRRVSVYAPDGDLRRVHWSLYSRIFGQVRAREGGAVEVLAPGASAVATIMTNTTPPRTNRAWGVLEIPTGMGWPRNTDGYDGRRILLVRSWGGCFEVLREVICTVDMPGLHLATVPIVSEH